MTADGVGYARPTIPVVRHGVHSPTRQKPVIFRPNIGDPMGAFAVAKSILTHGFINNEKPDSLQVAHGLAAQAFKSKKAETGSDFSAARAASSIATLIPENSAQAAAYNTWFNKQPIEFTTNRKPIQDDRARLDFGDLTKVFTTSHNLRGSEKTPVPVFRKPADFSESTVNCQTIEKLEFGDNFTGDRQTYFAGVEFKDCTFTRSLIGEAFFDGDCIFTNCTVISEDGNELKIPMLDRNSLMRIKDSYQEMQTGKADRAAAAANPRHRMTNPKLGDGATQADFAELAEAYKPGGAVEILMGYLGLDRGSVNSGKSAADLAGRVHALPAAE